MSEAEPIGVLVVEDEPEFLRRYCDAIGAEDGLRLVGAVADLAHARALLTAGIPEVVIVDLGLPDGNGIELIRSVSAKRPDCDIMVVTVFGDEQHVVSPSKRAPPATS